MLPMYSPGDTSLKFIKDVLIKELHQVVKVSPWLAFVSLSSGIEFLGKCIDSGHPESWDIKGRSPEDFKNAIRQLKGLNKHEYLLDKPGFNLYDELRCGLVHGLAPKSKISLSHGDNEDKNYDKDGKVNFNIDELYADFKLACEDVISRDYLEPNKMNWAKTFVNFRISQPKHPSIN